MEYRMKTEVDVHDLDFNGVAKTSSIMKYIQTLFMAVLSLSFFSCTDLEEPDYREMDYGYVQFKLYKSASYVPVKAASDQQPDKVLEYLSDATKIRVEFTDGKNTLSQKQINDLVIDLSNVFHVNNRFTMEFA